ncbi:ribosomal protein uL18 [Acididesulfobacillus acetoxydans]|uniref:Large ribosomal subunit protein uL18 n=1 Tax=Acididesulfobacillus acetoxydans TaxID=1561005 RepID=A0A8S0XVA5_9FIRM|nr:50S ribosomal protein L18 [Acididesulfobacillus acetoxydans]CAA7600157.1 ribosomal protein uL18 [Acididesulfobacillus acetoxydans]CEJ09535.1 50S ribosomal protein L18 [Acididesulfobacillus acetoxydans]
MRKTVDRQAIRRHKHTRVRKSVTGTAERPRLAVFRSLNHIYAQVIDDTLGATLAAASSLDAEFKEAKLSGGNVEGAQKVGELIAKRARDKGIGQVVFDRGGNIYQGRVAALAAGAREGGLNF